jgi:TadE-like protein
MRRHCQNANRERGGTLIESALTLMVFFVIIFGIFEFGRLYGIYQMLTDAAREGARFSVAPFPGTSDLPTNGQVEDQVRGFLNAANVTAITSVSVSQTVTDTVNGVDVVFTEVEVTAPYDFLLFPFGDITLAARARMRNETN